MDIINAMLSNVRQTVRHIMEASERCEIHFNSASIRNINASMAITNCHVTSQVTTCWILRNSLSFFAIFKRSTYWTDSSCRVYGRCWSSWRRIWQSARTNQRNWPVWIRYCGGNTSSGRRSMPTISLPSPIPSSSNLNESVNRADGYNSSKSISCSTKCYDT